MIIKLAKKTAGKKGAMCVFHVLVNGKVQGSITRHLQQDHRMRWYGTRIRFWYRGSEYRSACSKRSWLPRHVRDVTPMEYFRCDPVALNADGGLELSDFSKLLEGQEYYLKSAAA